MTVDTRKVLRGIGTWLAVMGVAVALSILPEVISTVGAPPAIGNLAANAELSVENVVGDVPQILSGPVPRDGTAWSQDRAVAFGNRKGVLQLDLGSLVELRGLLVQAGAGDRYVIQSSVAGESWGEVWKIQRVEGAGVQTRTHTFDSPLYARYLRLRAIEPGFNGMSIVATLRVYAELPSSWPQAPESVGELPEPSFPWLTLPQIALAKAVLAWLGAALLLLTVALRHFQASKRVLRGAKYTLIAVAVVASAGWWDYFQLTNRDYNQQRHHLADVYHYYLASKYSEELGYTKLYRCSLAVDIEDGFRALQMKRRVTRDLTTNSLVPTLSVAMGASEECRKSFSEARWAAFRADVDWLRAHLPVRMWFVLGRDHGYNASPVFTMVAGGLAHLIPLSDVGLVVLISLDTCLLVVLWYLIWSSFGWYGASAAMIFWSTNLLGNDHTFLIGAFLRQDALAAMVVGVCFLRRGYFGAAGFTLVWATLLRIFPGFLLGGVGLKILAEMVRERRIVLSPAHRKLLAGAVAGLLVLGGGTILTTGSPDSWFGFASNLAKHRNTPQLQNVGIKTLAFHIDRPDFLRAASIGVKELTASYERHPLREKATLVIALLVLSVLLVSVAGEEDWIAAILGLVWLPFVTDVNNYYWSMLLLFGLLAASSPKVMPAFAVLIAGFAGLGTTFSYLGLGLYVWASLLVVLFLTWVALVHAVPKRIGRRDGRFAIEENVGQS